MFDIGWSELLVVAVLALVFVAPKDLPRMMRTLGQLAAKARSMAREFQQSFEDMARETELEELRKELAELRSRGDEPVMTAKPSPAPTPPLPVDDLTPDMADAIREAEAVENYEPPAPRETRGTEP